MTLRNRMILGGAVLVLGPFAVVGLAIRADTAGRLETQYRARVDALVAVAEDGLATERARLDARLAALVEAAGEDDRLRLALLGGGDTAYLRDWAERARVVAGLDALQLQDADGTILSSGHFRNDFGRNADGIARFLGGLGGRAGVVTFRRPDGAFRALARVEALALSGRPMRLVGGRELDPATLASLASGADVSVTLGAAPPPAPDRVDRAIELPAIGGDPPSSTVHLVISHSLEPMRGVLRSLDRRLALAFGLAALGTVLLAARLSAAVARPLEDLAAKAATVDLDRLDAEFTTDRRDEVGALSRLLAEMTVRLRASVSRLRESERRATLGDLARQVNHDLKNAFPPIRNVVRHLAEVAHSPTELARVFGERRATLDSGLAYLDDLATNWSRLATRPERIPCDIPAIAREVAGGRITGADPVSVAAPEGIPPVRADPVGLRRILENLVTNAYESGAGRVTISVEMMTTSGPGEAEGEVRRTVQLVVEDDGPGIPEAARDRAFEPYWTTKPSGSGLGLAIVRRLVSDYEGSIRIDDGDGQGTRFTVTFPAGGGT